METLLATVKTLLGLTDTTDDELLALYINEALLYINSLRYFTPTAEILVEPQYSMIACELAVSAYNKRGAEGQTSHSENGISRVYDSSFYPSRLVSMITPRVKVYNEVVATE